MPATANTTMQVEVRRVDTSAVTSKWGADSREVVPVSVLSGIADMRRGDWSFIDVEGLETDDDE